MDYLVTAAEEGWRVADVLRRRLRVSYSALQSAKWHERVLLNGRPVRADTRVRAGDVAAFLPEPPRPAFLPEPWDCPLKIAYRDENLMIIDKPAPLPSQCGKGHDSHTLENALYSWLGCQADFVYRPVNRLDKGTSGLMAVALDAHIQQLMQRELHSPSFQRTYLAVTDGRPPEDAGVIRLPIAKEEAASVRRVVSGDGRMSVTHYEVLAVRNEPLRALVRLTLETGRTHQIRVHLSHMGCPVHGDFLYGEESPLLPGRFALHSAELTLTHPLTGESLRFISPLPEALARLMGETFP
ncbi:MAG: RluA family pseudouridine synthase [Clostridia bacterium]|nr:RluA family pseudouridine synthase [Clostridia bacterium]